MRHPRFLVILFLILHLSSSAQSHKIDSLKTLLQTADHDTTRINTLLALAREVENNPDTAILLSTQALELCAQLPLTIKRGQGQVPFRTHGTALSHRYLGIFNGRKGNLPLALSHNFQALKISEELQDKKGLAFNFGNIGVVYISQGDYPKALEYYFKALKIGEELSDKKLIGGLLMNIGNIYDSQGDYPRALEHQLRALKINEEIGNKTRIAFSLGNIGVVYTKWDDYPKALEYYFKALKIDEE
ncbi:MAG: hypothetical protein COB88_05320, partial [Flavobacteriales bacterium]